ncbi:hypothetical protein S245_072405 [Arachis hypogaea]|nr:uncharacterized protein DS421_13g439710 [Arachis hypogaea]
MNPNLSSPHLLHRLLPSKPLYRRDPPSHCFLISPSRSSQESSVRHAPPKTPLPTRTSSPSSRECRHLHGRVAVFTRAFLSLSQQFNFIPSFGENGSEMKKIINS